MEVGLGLWVRLTGDGSNIMTFTVLFNYRIICNLASFFTKILVTGDLVNGEIDIAVAGMTKTSEREEV